MKRESTIIIQPMCNIEQKRNDGGMTVLDISSQQGGKRAKRRKEGEENLMGKGKKGGKVGLRYFSDTNGNRKKGDTAREEGAGGAGRRQ